MPRPADIKDEGNKEGVQEEDKVGDVTSAEAAINGTKFTAALAAHEKKFGRKI